MRVRAFARGEAACVQGERGEAAYTIESGTFEVMLNDGDSGAPNVIARLGPPRMFGEMALLSNAPRSASVVCADAKGCVVNEMGRDAFLRVLRRSPEAADHMRALSASNEAALEAARRRM